MIPYYYCLVSTYVYNKNLAYPMYTTCAEVGGKYYRIYDLEKYLSNGKDGISDEEITVNDMTVITSNSVL